MKDNQAGGSDAPTFDAILKGHSVDVVQIAGLARDLVLSTLPKVVEVVWARQQIAGYGVGPKKMSEHFCYIAPQRAYVNLGFFYGSDLDDATGLLEGDGKLLRHVKLRSVGDVENPDLLKLVRTASRYLPKLEGGAA